MSRLAFVASRVVSLGKLDLQLIRTPLIPLPDRLSLLLRRYVAVARNRRRLTYLNHQFRYDNRFDPFLLPGYLTLIGELRRRAELRSASFVLDVGANVGQFAATCAWLHPNLTVLSLEPNPFVSGVLADNARQMTDGRWRVANFGIGETDASVDLWFVRGKSSQGSVFRSNAMLGLAGGSAEAVAVRLRPMDADVAKELGVPQTIDLLKIDVEGAERAVLHGLAGVPWRYMLIELSLEREGLLSLEDLQGLVRDLWGFKPRVLWTSSDASQGESSMDVLLAHPDA